MKPAYWIGILAILGGVIGVAMNRLTGWYGAVAGIVIGIVAGVIVFALITRKPSQRLP